MCAILQEENFGRRKKTPGTKKSRNADKYERVNWDSRLPDPTAPGEEFDSSKLGRDRRRRYLNEKILRDMAGMAHSTQRSHTALNRFCRNLFSEECLP